MVARLTPRQRRRTPKAQGALAATTLESSKDWKERIAAIVELASLGCHGLPFVGSLAARLHDFHPKVRLAAARAFKTLGSDAVTPHAELLTGLALKDPRRDVREAASEALSCMPVFAPPSEVGSEESARSEFARLDHVWQDDLPRHMQPQFWGVRVQQLIDFRNELFNLANPDNLVDYCDAHKFTFVGGACVHVCLHYPCSCSEHKEVPYMPLSDAKGFDFQTMLPNMHMVVAREIKPRTKPHGCSFARMLNPEGLEITTFVTHTWEERFDHFVGTLEMALSPEEVVWVCSCALDQNADIKQLLDSDDLLLSPFAKALRHAPKLVVTLDEDLKVPERSWCAFELEKASQWAIPTFMWPYHLTSFKDLADKMQTLDIRRASATSKLDQERIHKAIQEGIGYDSMNERLRSFLGDRLRFYEAAVSKHVGQLAVLMQDIEEAKRQNDIAQLAALQAEKLGEQRLMQLEIERKTMQEMNVVALHIDPARIQEEEGEHHQEHQRQRQLENDLEEVRREKDQAEQAMLQAQAEVDGLASQLHHKQVRESQPHIVRSRTLVTCWPAVAVPAKVATVLMPGVRQAGPTAPAQQAWYGPNQIYHMSRAVTISHIL